MATDKFYPTPLKKLLSLILNQEKQGHILGIPKELFYVPKDENNISFERFGKKLDTPIGVAAGPQSQLSQNIIGAWLGGARYIELKTVQTLDELEVAKPCIDMRDEGYNCEWSQELKIQQTFDEYLNAWIIIHVLNHKFGWNADAATIFNMSVGYNLEGILNENVQWFFDKMNYCKEEKEAKIESLKEIYPQITEIEIPNQISDNITLSTMHGCPPDEIEKIGKYLIEEKGLQTIIKLNPTLLGAEELRGILNDKLGFKTTVPDLAFEHDLKYPDALNLIKSLQKSSEEKNVFFGLKLTNTLESVNKHEVFGKESGDMMYMSGRALHPISVNVSRKLQNEFDGKLDVSFSAGADCFNITDIIACGLKPVTVSSDLLKPGGYARMKQYIDELLKSKVEYPTQEKALERLNSYAKEVLENPHYKRSAIQTPSIKTQRELSWFDCIKAPCSDTCATNQDIPEYLYHASNGDFEKAFAVIMRTNPFPSVTGMVCDHLCQTKCTRINYDNSLLIREVKRFVSEQNFDFEATEQYLQRAKDNDKKVAIIGAGPSGLSCAFYLRLAGFEVNVFEGQSRAGGMVSNAIPSFRLTDKIIAKDVERIEKLGVKIHFDTKVDKAFFEKLKDENDAVYVAAGAALAAKFNIEGIDANGVLDSLQFLFDARKGNDTGIGKNVAIIGGGNTAMDAARTAYRLVGKDGKVTIVYRRTVDQMPADMGEIKAVLEEGMEIKELTAPLKINTENGKVKSLSCEKMKLGEKDSSGRARPVKIENSEFEMEFDTIIPAIGQALDIDFVDNNLLETEDDFLTKVKNVYIGGDAKRGAATAIKAIGDGRRAASQIIEDCEIDYSLEIKKTDKVQSINELKVRKATREKGVSVKEISLDDRKNFKLVSQSLTAEEVKKEAARCLNCDELCNVCVTVCPNFANYSYQVELQELPISKVIQKNGETEIVEFDTLKINQKHQILNIADWCNECGNCNIFCPTNSAPYKEKPKFHITKESFDNAICGFFLENENEKLLLKEEGEVVSLINAFGKFVYENKFAKVVLNKEFEVMVVEQKGKEDYEISLEKATRMKVLLPIAKELLK